MRKLTMSWLLLLLFAVMIQPAGAQFGDLIKKAKDLKKAVDIYTPWTAEQEEAIGEASAAKLIHIFGLYDNPEMVKYVNLVGHAVARQGARTVPYRFGILDTEAITALALPGGYIFVTRGALANMSNEAELAGALAHEVAHVDGRHLEKEVRARKTSQFAKEEAAKRVPAGAELIDLAGEVVKTALTLKVSRGMETEADKKGMELVSRAGYNAAGLRDFLEVLAKASADAGNRRQLGLWGSTHPPFGERVAMLTALISIHGRDGQTLQERFIKNINPMSFAKVGSAGGGTDLEGVVSKGVVVLVGGQLPEGTRVKVRVKE